MVASSSTLNVSIGVFVKFASAIEDHPETGDADRRGAYVKPLPAVARMSGHVTSGVAAIEVSAVLAAEIFACAMHADTFDAAHGESFGWPIFRSSSSRCVFGNKDSFERSGVRCVHRSKLINILI